MLCNVDSSSQVCFIQKDLIKKLKRSGRNSTLNLKIVNSERTKSTMLIEYTDVKRVSGKNS